MGYDAFYRQSIEEPERFWGEQARLIHWETPPQKILDASKLPFRRWFVGGTTNLCYNAVDRHLAERGEQLALVAISTETGATEEITYRVLYREVNRFAGILQSLDVGKGDRVVIYYMHPVASTNRFVFRPACVRGRYGSRYGFQFEDALPA